MKKGVTIHDADIAVDVRFRAPDDIEYCDFEVSGALLYGRVYALVIP